MYIYLFILFHNYDIVIIGYYPSVAFSNNNTDKNSNEAWNYCEIDVKILKDCNVNFKVVSGLI